MAFFQKRRTTRRAKSRRAYYVAKRVQDVVLSLLGLAFLSPFLLLTALAITLDDPHAGPIFTQIRCGKDGKEFKLYKFRTMWAGAEDNLAALLPRNELDGPAFKVKDDPRVTRFGHFLRKTSLDELPQLLNILRGEMSLVGPRPPLPQEVARYTEYQRQRLKVVPGLTGLWQTQPHRYRLPFDRWVELDLRYIQEQSFWLDWKLLFRTVVAVFRREGQ